MAKSKHCKYCKRETVHEEFEDRAISTGKIISGVLLTGLPLFGIRKGKNYYCMVCGTVN